MNLDRVTITGADDSISCKELAEISKEMPFVEWGILVSMSNMGSPRFPSLKWIAELFVEFQNCLPIQLSIHVCGKWVREICTGNWTPLFCNIGPILYCAKRVQLNFHSCTHLLSKDFLPNAIKRSRAQGWQIIFQCDGINDHLVSNSCDDGLNAVPLYDRSGGAGILPDSWPRAMKGICSGYAGGLGPDNLADELPKIAQAADGQAFWVDMERRVRSDDDQQFDLSKVRRVLEIASEFVTKP